MWSGRARISAGAVAVVGFSAAAVLSWNTQDHEVRVGLVWVVAGIIVGVATWSTGLLALSRPWSPSSPQWVWVAGVAFAGSAVVLADLVRNLLVHRVVVRPDSVGGRP
jgi:hypothetical protein